MSSHSLQDDIAYVNKILYRYDPIGIAIPDDEYASETRMIAERMRSVESESLLLELIHHTFCAMFSQSMLAGPIENYCDITKEIWAYIQNSD